MKKSKPSSYLKVIAFVLIAIVVISAVGFVSNGWQPIIDPSDKGNTEGEKPSGSEGEDVLGGSQDIPVVVEPKYYSYLTGLETTEQLSRKLPLVFLSDPSAPLYGVSGSPLTVEFPTENGTRILVFSNSATALGKIGPIKPTRAFASRLLNSFGGVILSLGEDDILDYGASDTEQPAIDLTKLSGHHYTEPEGSFTNGDLVKAALGIIESPDTVKEGHRLPYCFADPDDEILAFDLKANALSIPLGTESTELKYDREAKCYQYYKGGTPKQDMLNANTLSYDNVFVLLADSITYETADGTELVMRTDGSGIGYYLTGGTYTQFKWIYENGNMIFYDEHDNKLTVNRGTSYLSFVKTTKADAIRFT